MSFHFAKRFASLLEHCIFARRKVVLRHFDGRKGNKSKSSLGHCAHFHSPIPPLSPYYPTIAQLGEWTVTEAGVTLVGDEPAKGCSDGMARPRLTLYYV